MNLLLAAIEGKKKRRETDYGIVIRERQSGGHGRLKIRLLAASCVARRLLNGTTWSVANQSEKSVTAVEVNSIWNAGQLVDNHRLSINRPKWFSTSLAGKLP